MLPYVLSLSKGRQKKRGHICATNSQPRSGSSSAPAAAQSWPTARAALGGRALLALGSGTAARGGPAAALAVKLSELGLIATSYAVAGEPQIIDVEEGARLARAAGCDLVIGIGGGSVLDTAKAIAALAPNTGRALDYMEVVGAGRPLERAGLPVIAVPTTAGTGSEVTRNAVVAAPEQRAKASIRHASLLPRLALVDSTLTHDLPPHLTASSGLDALTQLIEPYVSRARPADRRWPMPGRAGARGLGAASRLPHAG